MSTIDTTATAATAAATAALANALDAAAVWLERIGAPPQCVVVATVAPGAGLGVHLPGAETVGQLRIGDSEAEVLEACAPVVQRLLAALHPDAAAGALALVASGRRRLQLLLLPDAGEAALRLVGEGRVEVLGAGRLTPDPDALH